MSAKQEDKEGLETKSLIILLVMRTSRQVGYETCMDSPWHKLVVQAITLSQDLTLEKVPRMKSSDCSKD